MSRAEPLADKEHPHYTLRLNAYQIGFLQGVLGDAADRSHRMRRLDHEELCRALDELIAVQFAAQAGPRK
jgi:hypothetical protein